MANLARTPAEVIAGEAVHGTLQERFTDMVHIASVMANRARLTGRSLKDVVSATSKRGVKQFSAYGKSLPDGTKNLVSLAERAIAMVEQNGPITPATYYATPAARTSLPPGLTDVGTTTGHVYAIDPENRAIGVGSGFVRPSVGIRNPTQPMGGTSIASSRQNLPPDRQMPSGDIRATLGRQPGPGLAALAPNGLANPLDGTQQRGFVASYGPSRPMPPQQSLIDNIGTSVGNVFGPNSAFYGTSGQQSPAQKARIDRGRAASAKARAGGQLSKQEQADRAFANAKVNRNDRHPTGQAMDTSVKSYDLSRPVNGVAMEDIGMDFAARNGALSGIGFGPGYMGPKTIHLDKAGIGGVWGGGVSPQFKDNMEFAKATGIGPTPTFGAPTPSPRPTYEARQRQQMADTMQEAGIRGLGATSQLSAPIGNVERQNLQAPTQYAGRPASVARSAAGPALAAALERAGISRPSPLSSQDAAARMGAASPLSGQAAAARMGAASPLSDQNAAARMGPQTGAPAGQIYSPAPTQYEGRPASVARSVAGPNLSRALAERGLTGSTGAAPSSMAPDRPMPSGAISRPNLAAALEKRGIASPTQYAGRPASVASRVASATSAGSTVGIPGQTAPESPTLGPAPTAPGDVTQTTIGPAGIRPGLIATGPIQTRPKVSIPAPTRVAPVRTQPRVVQPVQQPPQPIQPVQAPAPLGQQAFAARANPVDPGLRAADVYGGAIGTAQTSTPGTTVSRQNSWGPTTVTNKFGAQTAMVGDRQAAVGKPFGGLGGNLSPNAKSVLGGLAGGILGAMAAGPTGALAGGMLGRKMASGGLGGSSAPGGGGGQAGGGLLGGMFGGGTVGNARGGNNERSGGTGGGTIGGGGGRGRRGGQGN